eukprot:Seg2591.3 transcript_id=Seg2591.3/GoldUCD/mRNA.D3Y31 product="D-like dopamine receptor" protein_id=Seg2591.3/GoldUCD/D3Y31
MLNTTLSLLNYTSIQPKGIPQRPRGILVPFNPVNAAICILAIILNLAEMVIICRLKKRKAFERILLSLCVADISVEVWYLIAKSYEFVNKKAIFGKDKHLIGYPIEMFSIMSSITNIIILGIDRAVAVKYPLKHGVWMTNRRVHGLIASAWIGSIALSVLCGVTRFANPHDKSQAAKEIPIRVPIYVSVAIIFTSMVIIAAIYTFIFRIVRKRNKLMKDMKIASVQGETKREETAIIITCVLVVGAFIACTLPFCIDALIDRRRGKPILPIKLILLNPLLDPLIYFFKGYLKKRLNNKNTGSKTPTTDLSNRSTPLVVRKDLGGGGGSKTNLLELAVANIQKSVDTAGKDSLEPFEITL